MYTEVIDDRPSQFCDKPIKANEIIKTAPLDCRNRSLEQNLFLDFCKNSLRGQMNSEKIQAPRPSRPVVARNSKNRL